MITSVDLSDGLTIREFHSIYNIIKMNQYLHLKADSSITITTSC